MGKTYYKHRPDDEKEHFKNASRTHGHAKYKRMRDTKEGRRLRLTQEWVDRVTDPDQDDYDPTTIP
jgi:hypothetical protein